MTYHEAVKLAYKVKSLIGLPNMITAGSVRRQKPIVSDLDFVLVTEDKRYTNIRLGQIFGYNKTNSRAKRQGTLFGVHVDIVDVPVSARGSALMHLTGPNTFNIKCRWIAKSKGWKLNQYGLFDVFNKLVCDCSNEETIFEALGLPYTHPWER